MVMCTYVYPCVPFVGQKGDSCLVCDMAGLRGPPGPQGPPGEIGKTPELNGTLTVKRILRHEGPQFLHSKLKPNNEDFKSYFQDFVHFVENHQADLKISTMKIS